MPNQLSTTTILLVLSGSGLHAGRRAQLLGGGGHICERGSSHIPTQDKLSE
jgi:hypothetical protein